MHTSVSAETNSPAIIAGVDSGSITEDVNVDSNHRLRAKGKLNITDNVIQVLSWVAPVEQNTITSLAMQDTYYFSVTALVTEGRKSQYSSEVVITS